MQETLEGFYADAVKGITLFDTFVEKHSLHGKALPDHIGYKCASREAYEKMRAMLEPESEYLFQSFISGRRIAYLKLKRPFDTTLGPIHFLELCDQKPDGSQRDGFDHIEVYSSAGTYEDLVAKFAAAEKVIHVARPHHTTDDIELSPNFLFRCTQGPLIEKIKTSEM